MSAALASSAPRATLLATPAVAKLLLELQAEIVKEVQERADSVSDPLGDLRAPITRIDEDELIQYTAANGRDEYRQRRFCPECWRGGAMPWHPSHWREYLTRTDSTGCGWAPEGVSTVHVTDDFGQLVPVGDAP
jgi:hypothetical protein